MAAVLAIGAGSHRAGDLVLDYWGAAVSHRGAACLWNLLSIGDHPADVIVKGDSGRANRRGIRVHRSYMLIPRGNPAPGDPGHDTDADDRRSAPGCVAGMEGSPFPS